MCPLVVFCDLLPVEWGFLVPFDVLFLSGATMAMSLWTTVDAPVTSSEDNAIAIADGVVMATPLYDAIEAALMMSQQEAVVMTAPVIEDDAIEEPAIEEAAVMTAISSSTAEQASVLPHSNSLFLRRTT